MSGPGFTVLLVTTTNTLNRPNPIDVEPVPHTCPVCGTVFPSFAAWTRQEAGHYLEWKNRTASRLVADDNEGVTDRDNVDRPDHWTGGAKNVRPTSDPASEKQIAFVARLRQERGLPTPDGESLSKRQASRLIDSLMATPVPANVHQADPAQTPPVRSNRFDGPCVSCRQNVPAETGSIDKVDGKWIVRHVGSCPTDTAAAAPTSSVDVPDGYYAIVSTGSNDLAFYRVKHSDRWGVSVSLVVGGHADSYAARKAIPSILARIAADPEAAKRYADEIGCCYRCNRTLTDEESRRQGIGPTCRNLA